MIDRYHEIYQLERNLISEGAHDDETRPISQDRNRLHKQLERLGKILGKAKDVVLADVIAREGNLGEFLLPEYGIIMPDQLSDNDDLSDVPGFDTDQLRRGDFVVHTTRKEINAQLRNNHNDNVQREIDGGYCATEDIPGMGERAVVSHLEAHEVLVVFGTLFNEGINGRSIRIEPPGFPEKLRRAARAVDALKAKNIPAKLLIKQLGLFHDATTIVGVVIPADTLEVQLVGLLRKHHDLYGVRPQDLDAHAIEEEYQNHVNGPICPLDIADLTTLFSEIREEERSVVFERFRAAGKNGLDKVPTITDQVAAVIAAYPEYLDRTDTIREVLTMHRERVRDTFLEPFRDVHQKYFGERS